MKSLEQWMADYQVSHQHPTNQLIHKICVPAIMLSVLGFCWLAPVPGFITVNFFNWATLVATAGLIFYLLLSWKMFLAMLLQLLIMLSLVQELDQMNILLPTSSVIFVLAWAAQFYGHQLEGKKPSFFQDLTFLLIGPLWVTRFIFIKLNIRHF
jgi:uncharacterized membrane protein YGL010W